MPTEVKGVEETIMVLLTVPKAVYDELVNGIQDAAGAIAKGISIPSEPVTGFTTDARVDVGPSRKQKTDSLWPMPRPVLMGASIADMGGAGAGGTTPQGRVLCDALTARYGRASRWAWPAMEAGQDRLESVVQKVVDRVSAKTTKVTGG